MNTMSVLGAPPTRPRPPQVVLFKLSRVRRVREAVKAGFAKQCEVIAVPQ